MASAVEAKTIARDEHQERATDLRRPHLCWAMRKSAVRNGAGGRVLAPRAGGGRGGVRTVSSSFLSPLHSLEGLGSPPKRDRAANQPVLKNRQGAAPRAWKVRLLRRSALVNARTA